jgi:hypothetical protein
MPAMNEEESDGPPDEVEIGDVVEAEVKRLVRHPREETARLKQVAADGEHGSAPYIEMALVARWILPVVLVVVGVALLVYFKA